MHMADIED